MGDAVSADAGRRSARIAGGVAARGGSDVAGDENERRQARLDESGSGLPPGAFQLRNDAGLARYCGAGPPPGHGKHRYIFAVLALAAEKIEIDREATPAWLMFNLFNGTLGRAFLEGWYER